MDRVPSIEVFIEAVAQGRFTAGAHTFRTTPALVCKHVSALEKRLDTAILLGLTRRQQLIDSVERSCENRRQMPDQIAQAVGAYALEGIGIIMMPRARREPDIASGKLLEVPAGHLPPTRPIRAVYPRGRQDTSKRKARIEFVLAQFRPQKHGTRGRGHAVA